MSGKINLSVCDAFHKFRQEKKNMSACLLFRLFFSKLCFSFLFVSREVSGYNESRLTSSTLSRDIAASAWTLQNVSRSHYWGRSASAQEEHTRDHFTLSLSLSWKPSPGAVSTPSYRSTLGLRKYATHVHLYTAESVFWAEKTPVICSSSYSSWPGHRRSSSLDEFIFCQSGEGGICSEVSLTTGDTLNNFPPIN